MRYLFLAVKLRDRIDFVLGSQQLICIFQFCLGMGLRLDFARRGLLNRIGR